MESRNKIKIINNRKKSSNYDSILLNKFIMKIPLFIILVFGGVLSLLLYLLNIYIFNFDWKIPFIPIMIALQLVFLIVAIKSRYKRP